MSRDLAAAQALLRVGSPGQTGSLDPWRAARARAALDALAETGLPGAKDEGWWYTPTRRLLQAGYAPSATVEVPSDRADIVVVDGVVTTPPHRADGVYFGSLSEALRVPDITSEVLTGGFAADAVRSVQPADRVDGFAALAVAIASDGPCVVVAAGAHATVEIAFTETAGEKRLVAWQGVIVVGEGATLELVEVHRADGGGSSLSASLLDIELGVGAKLVHVRVLKGAEGRGTARVSRSRVTQHADSVYELTALVSAGRPARLETEVRLVGERAVVDLRGLTLGRGEDVADHHVSIQHIAPNTTSRQAFRAVLDDTARGVYTGRVEVLASGRGADAQQTARALLLSGRAVANARPQLLIRTDEVKATHGAAIGQLDREGLFYLAQRGLDPDEARKLLTVAFAVEVLECGLPAALSQRLLGELAEWQGSPLSAFDGDLG